MNDIAIQVNEISKQYHIGRIQQTNNRLGDQVVDALLSPFRRANKLLRGQSTSAAELDERIWALKDISFDITQGEVVGIVGRNGAGKSTMLKILSRITDPTEGYADIYGRVGSLLEVGTGFHPELTGRENIFLNGAILGMRKAEIERKFDEIVEFAEIATFIDTPVKHYSSGMYVRLAFSVAAHLDTDILLVDEVLAVGDTAFQRKCLGKMEDVAGQGRTVLFVSHNMGLLQALCQRGILLQNGEKTFDGSISGAVDRYLKTLEEVGEQDLVERTDRKGKGQIMLTKVEVEYGNGSTSTPIKTGAPVRITLHLNEIKAGVSSVIVLFNHLGQHLVAFESSIVGPEDSRDPQMGKRMVCEIDELTLLPGRYRINVLVRDSGEMQDFVEAAAFFDVEAGLLRGRPMKERKRISLSMPHRWLLPEEV